MSYHHLSTTERTARKPHRCFGCLRDIAPGTRYSDSRAVDDGHAFQYREHPECRDAALGPLRDAWDDTYHEGWILEAASDGRPMPDGVIGEAAIAWREAAGE